MTDRLRWESLRGGAIGSGVLLESLPPYKRPIDLGLEYVMLDYCAATHVYRIQPYNDAARDMTSDERSRCARLIARRVNQWLKEVRNVGA